MLNCSKETRAKICLPLNPHTETAAGKEQAINENVLNVHIEIVCSNLECYFSDSYN